MSKEEQENIEEKIKTKKISSVNSILDVMKKSKQKKCVICGKGQEDPTPPFLRVILKEEYKRKDQLQSPSKVTYEKSQSYSPIRKFTLVGRRFTPVLPSKLEKQRFEEGSVFNSGPTGYDIAFICDHCEDLDHNWKPLKNVVSYDFPKTSWAVK